MPYGPHVFAGNPFDRGDRERRDQGWLAARAVDPSSRFLVMPGLDVPVTSEGDGALRWLTHDDVLRLGIRTGEPVFLGKQDGVAHFAVHVAAESGAAASLGDDESMALVDARSAAGFLSGAETGIVAQARSLLDWHNRHGFCPVCGHRTAMGRAGMYANARSAGPSTSRGPTRWRSCSSTTATGACWASPGDVCRGCGCTRPSPGS